MAKVKSVILAQGTHSGQVSAQAAVPAGVTFATFVLTSTTFATDPTARFTLAVDVSYDGGTTWKSWAAITANGGLANTFKNDDGSFWDGLPGVEGYIIGSPTHARVTATMTPNTIVWGATIEVS